MSRVNSIEHVDRPGRRYTFPMLLFMALTGMSVLAPVAPAQSQPENEADQGSILRDAAAQLQNQEAPANEATPPTPATMPNEPAAASSTADGRDPASYQLWVLAPAVVAILLAIFMRQVIAALVVGVLVGAYMVLPCYPADSIYAQFHPVVGGFRLAAEKFVMGSMLNADDNFYRLRIMMFTLFIAFMVGVMGRNGGTAGMVKLVAGDTDSPRRGALTAWLAGLVVFFDDYANTMIVGPTMRSVFDKLRMSRAKLAYIVDSTAAPVASIALIGTWVGAEVGFIRDGLSAIEADVPAFLADSDGKTLSAMQVFISSLPYRFYPILALVLVFLVAWTGRDFGPMKRSEALARSGKGSKAYEATSGSGDEKAAAPMWWLGVIPIVLLVGLTVALLLLTGYSAANGASVMAQEIPFWERVSIILQNSDSYGAIFYGSLLASIAAVILTALARTCSLREAVDAGVETMSRTFAALIILVLAWALSDVLKELTLAEIVSAFLEAKGFPAIWMPLAVFICSAGISFATGTSWGTMSILCPLTIPTMVRLLVDMDPATAQPLFFATVGSILAGSIFGDHCSPISDTTVLSSAATGCRHEEHVWTQIPYAIVAAIAAMGFGDVMCSKYQQPWYYGLGAGVLFLLFVIFVFGRRPKVVVEADVPSPVEDVLRRARGL